ncbi:putative Poly [ADP-ribose] polymerase protein, partial [Naja naja]
FMGMCSRQERIQKDIDIVIQKCKAEKDCLFADFRYADSTFTFTYVGGSKRYEFPLKQLDFFSLAGDTRAVSKLLVSSKLRLVFSLSLPWK